MMYCGKNGMRHFTNRTVRTGSSKAGRRDGITEKCAGMIRGSMLANKKGMEMVQVAILIALAVALGIIFRTEITKFVNNTFSTLNS